MSEELLDGPAGGEPPAGDSDWPSRLLAVLVTRTPFGRGEWGRAMLAELDEVPGTRDRRAFALGAARTMVLPGLGASLFVVASFSLVAAGVAAAAASAAPSSCSSYCLRRACWSSSSCTRCTG